MTQYELTRAEQVKCGIKWLASVVCGITGAFHLARWSTKPSVTIIAYHRIVDDSYAGIRPYISVKKSRLRKQLRFFRKYYRVISLEEAVDRLSSDRVDQHYLVITFDDGYADNYSIGLDLFRDEGIKPTVFVTTDCVEKQQALWPDVVRALIYNADVSRPLELDEPRLVITSASASKVRALRSILEYLKKMDPRERTRYLTALEKRIGRALPTTERLMLTWEEIKCLKRYGVSIGSHTVSHQVLAEVPDGVAAAELRASKQILEARIGSPVTLFAYPNGTAADFSEATVQHVKAAGYTAAVTTMRGINGSGSDLYRLRRTGVYLTDTVSVIKLKLVAESFIKAGMSPQ
jgi:peptidoglycan/xylan/chitin deacetylase (PgdA/CDA1 family)